MKNLYDALLRAQQSIDEVEKDKTNSFHKYKYVSAEAMIRACRAALAAQGLVLIAAETNFSPVSAHDAVKLVEHESKSSPRREPDGSEVPGALESKTSQLTAMANDFVAVLNREYHLAHCPSGECVVFHQAWPVVPEKGRPTDKANAAADTASLGYFLRDLLLVPRVDEATDLDHESRDEAPRPAAKPAQTGWRSKS